LRLTGDANISSFLDITTYTYAVADACYTHCTHHLRRWWYRSGLWRKLSTTTCNE